MPDVTVDLVHPNAGFGAVLGDQAQFDGFGDLGEEREIGPRAVVGGTEWVRTARPYRDGSG